MAVSTSEVYIILILIILLAVAIWMYVVSLQRKKFLDTYKYARGSNAWQDNSVMNLSCGADREICIFRATQVCSGSDSNNFEVKATDPIASGLDAPDFYGDFNSKTTVDLTSAMSKKCNNQETCSYTFKASDNPFPNGMVCNAPANSQLISSYTCIPTGSKCNNYLGPYVPPTST